MTTISLPLTEAQTVAIVVAADAFGVEPWEMAVHALNVRDYILGRRRTP